jgi:hypothetical protein
LPNHVDIAQAAFQASGLQPTPPFRTANDALRYVTILLSMLPADERAGFLLKPGGENIAPLPDGTMVSVGRICYPNGDLVKVMGDVPNGNPAWVIEDNVGPARYYPAKGGTPQPDPVRDQVRALYLELLKREPDPGGWTHWTNQIKANGVSIDAVREALKTDPAYKPDAKPPVQDTEPKPPVQDTKLVAGNEVVVALQALVSEAQKQTAILEGLRRDVANAGKALAEAMPGLAVALNVLGRPKGDDKP